jgi:hypothetical protein
LILKAIDIDLWDDIYYQYSDILCWQNKLKEIFNIPTIIDKIKLQYNNNHSSPTLTWVFW